MINHLTNLQDMLDYVSAQCHSNPIDYRLRIVADFVLEETFDTDFGLVPVDTLINKGEREIYYGLYD